MLSVELSGPDTNNHETWRELFRKLRLATNLSRAHTPAVALAALAASPPPATVLLFDARVIEHDRLLAAVAAYTRAGGNLVICGAVCQDAGPLHYRAFFAALKLPFRLGGYYRSTHTLRPTASLSLPVQPAVLPPSCSVKAQTLLGIPEQARLFAPAPNAIVQFPTPSPGAVLLQRTEGAVTSTGPTFAAIYKNLAGEFEAVSEVGARTVDPAETAAFWLKVGIGRLGFVGDINGEPTSVATVLVMCGVAHGYAMDVMLKGTIIGPISINTGAST